MGAGIAGAAELHLCEERRKANFAACQLGELLDEVIDCIVERVLLKLFVLRFIHIIVGLATNRHLRYFILNFIAR